MKKSERQAILRGANLIKQFGAENQSAVIDFCEIQELNDKHAASWGRGNNSGNAYKLNKESKKQDKLWTQAQEIAKRNGWKIEAPGLYWTITDKNGQEIR